MTPAQDYHSTVTDLERMSLKVLRSKEQREQPAILCPFQKYEKFN